MYRVWNGIGRNSGSDKVNAVVVRLGVVVGVIQQASM